MRHSLSSEPYPPLQVQWRDRKSPKPQPRRRIRINPRIRFRSKDVDGEAPETPLPIAVVRRSGGVSRYVCDGGARLRLVEVDRGEADEPGTDGGFRRFLRMSKSAVRELFVPRRVRDNYMDYVKWKLLHRVFSSALQVLATQAMFRAIGIGSSQSLSSAAALNWLLKDGLGRLSRCIYTASVGSAFDTNLKRVRFSTSILFSLSIGIELMTPAFPQYFLLLATVANIAKSISLAAYIVTGSAIHRSFAIADNLGEVSAKSQVQTVCFDNVGLMLAALMNMLCKNNQRFQATLPLFIYPIFSTIDLFSIYQGLKHVHLQTLTKDRLEIILDTWIHLGFIPSPAVVSNKEGIGLLRRQDSKTWPIRIGFIDTKKPPSRVLMLTLRSLSGSEFYLISMETSYRGLTRTQQHVILLYLGESAGTTDIITGLLQACYIRKKLLQDEGNLNCLVLEDPTLQEWFKMVEASKRCAEEEIPVLMEEIKRSGWGVQNVLLNAQEQIRYTYIDE